MGTHNDCGECCLTRLCVLGAVYEDSSLVFPNNPTLNTGGCPYRGLTYRPSYMKSLNPSVECALAPTALGAQAVYFVT